jgi:hypothetical protein
MLTLSTILPLPLPSAADEIVALVHEFTETQE